MLGVDLVSVSRIAALAERSWYLDLWMRPSEVERARSCPNPSESLAATVTAKEAVMKAAGRGFRQGVRPADVCLEWSPAGAPHARLDGDQFALSMTHSDGFAAAVAIKLGGESD